MPDAFPLVGMNAVLLAASIWTVASVVFCLALAGAARHGAAVSGKLDHEQRNLVPAKASARKTALRPVAIMPPVPMPAKS